MPVWHGLTKELVERGELVVVGITQEQHPDRCALFARWKGLGFPILWDPFNLTGIDAVPALTAVDEHGIVRLTRPDPRRFQEQIVEEFLGGRFEDDPGRAAPRAFRMSRGGVAGAAELERLRGRLGLPYGPRPDDSAAASTDRASSPEELFRAGVAARMDHDGPAPRPGDFQRAADLWQRALAARPDQYVWRRRIQQWGPRLDKPYPFYDWVHGAAREIAARGEEPVALRVPLSGAEVAGRSRAVPRGTAGEVEPDPDGLVARDAGALVRVETAVVLHTGAAGPNVRAPRGASRIHVALRPREDAGWTPDADPAELWLEVPEGWTSEARRARFPAPDGDGDRAKRAPLSVDLEVSTPPVPLVPPVGAGAPPASARLQGYVLYSVCEADGSCVFRRQDVEIVIQLPTPGAAGEGGQGRGGDDEDR